MGADVADTVLPLAGWVTPGKVLPLLNCSFTVGKARTLRTVASICCRIHTQEMHCGNPHHGACLRRGGEPVLTPVLERRALGLKEQRDLLKISELTRDKVWIQMRAACLQHPASSPLPGTFQTLHS